MPAKQQRRQVSVDGLCNGEEKEVDDEEGMVRVADTGVTAASSSSSPQGFMAVGSFSRSFSTTSKELVSGRLLMGK